jgi:hypothetical protein
MTQVTVLTYALVNVNYRDSSQYTGESIILWIEHIRFLGYKVMADWLSYLVGNKCHNIFLFISVCNIGYVDVSCSELNDVLVMTVGNQSISELKFIKYTQMLVFWWCCRVRCDSTKFWRKLVSWICFEVEQMFCVSQSSISDTFVSYSSALKCHVTFQSLVVDISKGLYRKATTSHSHLHFKLDGMDFLCQKSLDHLWAWLVHWLWDVLLAWYMIFI